MERQQFRRLISVILFAIYACVLIYFLFFAENMGRTATYRGYSFNLVPFKEMKRFITHIDTLGYKVVLLNICGNILAFVPFGFFIIPVLGRRIGFKEAILLSFDVSVLVEIFQLFTRVGSFDVDDIMLNALGGILGAIGYFVWKSIDKKRAIKDRERIKGSGQI